MSSVIRTTYDPEPSVLMQLDPSRYIEENAFDPFLAKGEKHSRNPSNTAIYEGEEEHYFRSTTYKRPTSITTVPYSDEDQDSETSTTSRSISSIREFPSGVNKCEIPTGVEAGGGGGEDEARGTIEPEDRGQTIAQFGGLKIKGMILVGGSYDNVKQMKWESQLGLSQGESEEKRNFSLSITFFLEL